MPYMLLRDAIVYLPAQGLQPKYPGLLIIIPSKVPDMPPPLHTSNVDEFDERAPRVKPELGCFTSTS